MLQVRYEYKDNSEPTLESIIRERLGAIISSSSHAFVPAWKYIH